VQKRGELLNDLKVLLSDNWFLKVADARLKELGDVVNVMSNGEVDIICAYSNPDEFFDTDQINFYMEYKGKNFLLFFLFDEFYDRNIYPDKEKVNDLYFSLAKIIEGFVQIKDEIVKYGRDWSDYVEEIGEHNLEFLTNYYSDIDKAFKVYIYDDRVL